MEIIAVNRCWNIIGIISFNLVYTLVKSYDVTGFREMAVTEYYCKQWSFYDTWEQLCPGALYKATNCLHWAQPSHISDLRTSE